MSQTIDRIDSDLEVFRVATVQWVNRIISKYSLGDPIEDFEPGVRYSPHKCAVSRALGEGWRVAADPSAEKWDPGKRHWSVREIGPPEAKYFLTAFDDGLYPDLIDN